MMPSRYFISPGVRVEINWMNSSKAHKEAFVPQPEGRDDPDDMWGVYERLPNGKTELLGIFPLHWRASDFLDSLIT